ncbi:MAG: ATP-binding protein [Desulfobacteraceae bacterium]
MMRRNEFSRQENRAGRQGRKRASRLFAINHRNRKLMAQNRMLKAEFRDLSHFHFELERKNNELETIRDELRKQNIQLIKKSIELSDVMRQLEDKNYDLRLLHGTLEDQVAERTNALRIINRKLIDEIREKNQAQAALKESEEQYRTVFENSGTAIFIIEADMRVTMANAKSSELTGVPSSAIEKGMFWTEFVAEPETREKMMGYHRTRRQSTDAAPGEYEFKLKHSSGQVKDVLVYVKTISGTDKSIASMIDITNRRQAEREKLELEKQLQQAHKMEAIGTLAGGIAHDFNNILTALMGYIEMALDAAPKNTDLPRWLERSLKGCMRARDLVVQILTFSRQNELEMKPIRIAPIFKEAVKFLRATIPSTITFDLHVGCDQEMVYGDPTQVHQVMMNLCTNAAHAMSAKGGQLGIMLRPVVIDENLAYKRGLTEGKYIELTISDTGHGITPSIMGHIFDPFFTTKKVGEGTGMGLAMTHGIVQRMGGNIVVESTQGVGTVFTVYFPEVCGEVEVVETGLSEDCGKNERILLVDDDESVLEVMDELIALLGYTVVSTTSSHEAIRVFQSDPAAFELVITDQTMPHMTGLEFAQSLLTIRPDIPIIMCTGFSDTVGNAEADKIGISAFLMKPVERSRLASTIRKVLDDKRVAG